MAKSDLLTEILIRSVKIADIGYIYSLLGLVGIGLATGLNYLYGKFEKASEDKKSVFQVVIEIILMLWLNGIMVYVFLNIFELVPSPFHGLYGYDHGKTFKSYAQVPLAISLFWFQTYLLQKMQYYKDRVIPSGSGASTISLAQRSTPPQLPGGPQPPQPPMGPQPPQPPMGPQPPQPPMGLQLPQPPMGPQPSMGPNKQSQPLIQEPGPTSYRPTPQFMPNVSTFTPAPK
jgi:hypothetical protein